jgi:hypothetical protein
LCLSLSAFKTTGLNKDLKALGEGLANGGDVEPVTMLGTSTGGTGFLCGFLRVQKFRLVGRDPGLFSLSVGSASEFHTLISFRITGN